MLAQEVAELLGQAQAHCKHVGYTLDQDAFVICIHGTTLYLTAAHFTKEYLENVRGDALPLSQRLYVRRSEVYRLKEMDGRLGALRLCLAVLDYLWSGEAEVGQLQLIHGKI